MYTTRTTRRRKNKFQAKPIRARHTITAEGNQRQRHRDYRKDKTFILSVKQETNHKRPFASAPFFFTYYHCSVLVQATGRDTPRLY